ncbi:MAG: outer membrane lipoprotein-sorting protein [Spirochaetaceae bacterium]|nr:outer membrane lipoprotein-sorting protein [Spirochaetaceae bacterium]
MRLLAGFVAGLVMPFMAWAQQPSAEALLERIDNNEVYGSISYDGEMVIAYQGRRYVKTMRVWAKGGALSFVEFTNPEDAGTKYLKRDGRLYVFSPDTEEVMPISGHMLRESMMGSDMSYEDTVDNDKLSVRYTPRISGEDVVDGKACWVLELTANKKTESYPTQKIWVEKVSGDMVRSEQFALSGTKLKVYSLRRVESFGGKRFPVEMEIRDLLRKDSSTVMTMKNVVLDKPIDDGVFRISNLR